MDGPAPAGSGRPGGRLLIAVVATFLALDRLSPCSRVRRTPAYLERERPFGPKAETP